MAVTLFKDSTYNLSSLVEEIRRGEIGLPDIQRPFVWRASKVRDLFDSMYKGFPVGFLLFWATGAEAGARQIGTDGKETPPKLLIVDGQQRRSRNRRRFASSSRAGSPTSSSSSRPRGGTSTPAPRIPRWSTSSSRRWPAS